MKLEQLEAVRAWAGAAVPLLQRASVFADDEGWQTFASDCHRVHEKLTEALASNPAKEPDA